MGQSTKSQFYHYTLRSVAVINGVMCTDRAFLYVVPPQDALTVESVFTHIRLQFDSGIPASDRVIEAIGITNQRPLFYQSDPTIERLIDVNLAADGNRRIDIKLDLSSLLTGIKENVGYTPLIGADYDDGDQTFIVLKLPQALRGTLAVGTIELWKADVKYTTREIR